MLSNDVRNRLGVAEGEEVRILDSSSQQLTYYLVMKCNSLIPLLILNCDGRDRMNWEIAFIRL